MYCSIYTVLYTSIVLYKVLYKVLEYSIFMFSKYIILCFCLLQIYLSDLNDNAPVIVIQGEPSGIQSGRITFADAPLITTVSTRDPDFGVNGEVS